MWWHSYNSYDKKTLFQKNICPICGKKLKRFQKRFPLTEEEKEKIWRREHFVLSLFSEPHIKGFKSFTYYKCLNCNYENSAENQILVRQKQLARNKDILPEGDIKQLIIRSSDED